jgi:hypothetical protein
MLRMLRNVKGCYVEFFDDEARQEDTEKWRQHQENTKAMLRDIKQCCGDPEKCCSLCQENIERHPETFWFISGTRKTVGRHPGTWRSVKKSLGGIEKTLEKPQENFLFLFFEFRIFAKFRKDLEYSRRGIFTTLTSI